MYPPSELDYMNAIMKFMNENYPNGKLIQMVYHSDYVDQPEYNGEFYTPGCNSGLQIPYMDLVFHVTLFIES